MKALLTIVVVAFLSSAINANPGTKGDYLLTKDGKFIAAKVQLGIFKIHAKSQDGCLLDVKYNEVSSFQKDGETYTQKPLYNGRVKEGMVFMKLMSWRNGLGLYCYEDLSLGLTNNKRYFIFKDEDTFWLEVDSRNSETLQKFFNRV